MKRHLQAPKIVRKDNQLKKSDPLLLNPGGESPSQKLASASPASITPASTTPTK